MNDGVGSSPSGFRRDAPGSETAERDLSLLDSLDDSVFELDTAGEFVGVNDELLATTGYEREALLGEHVSTLPVDDEPELERTLERLQSNPATEVAPLEIGVETASGETLRWELQLSPLLDGDELVGTAGVAREVRDRESDGRREELQRAKRALEASHEGIGLLDEDGTFAYVNEAYAETFGYAPEAMIGEHWEELGIEKEPERFHEEVLPHVADEGRWSGTTTCVRNDGSTFLAEHSLTHTEDGELICIVEDVSEEFERQRDLERQERIIETLGDGVYALDEDSTFVMVNEAFCEMVGREREELLGQPSTVVYDDEIAPAAAEEAAAVAAGEQEVATLEFPLVREDGERVPVEARFRPFPGDDGSGRCGVIRDISDRRERERAVRQSERRYRTLIDNFPNGAVGLFDGELRYTVVGGQLFDALEYDPADREGRRIPDIHPDSFVEKIEPHFHAALAGETRQFEVEYEGLNLAATTLPIEDDDGEVDTGMVVIQDVTERRAAQRELRESEAKFRMLAENVDEVVWMATADGDAFRYVNPAFEDVWRLDREKLYDDPTAFLEAVHPEDRERVREQFEALPAERFDDEFRIVRPDGEQRWIYAQGGRVHDEETGMTRIVGTGLDITERKRRERALEASNERLEQFAYAASHDLQEPLRMVSSYLTLIEDRYGDELDEDGREFLEFAVDGAERMREMIHGLLDYSRVETRGDPFEPVDLEDVVADVRTDLELSIEESEAGVVVEDLPTVSGDRGQLYQLFQNLLTNAIEYSGDAPPTVRVSAERRGEEWAVTVADDGLGMEPEQADRAFELFQQLHPESDGGTGIGLALCKRIVERHGGDIEVETAPSEGAAFTFTLPAAGERDD